MNRYAFLYPTSTNPTAANRSGYRRLYSAKELTTDHGLNTYDFEARWLTPAFPRFTNPDPMASDYHPISPYAYCGGDPINMIDPTGKNFKSEKDRVMLLEELNKRKESLQKEIDNINTNGKRDNNGELTAKEQKKLNGLDKQMTHIDQAISDVNLLAEDPEHEYSLVNDQGYNEHKVTSSDGKHVNIQYSKLALAFHEICHVRQSLNSSKGLQFSKAGELKNASHRVFDMSKNEAEAYRIQYAFDRSSMPKSPGSISNINISYLRGIQTPSKEPAYPFAWDISEVCNSFIDEVLYRHQSLR